MKGWRKLASLFVVTAILIGATFFMKPEYYKDFVMAVVALTLGFFGSNAIGDHNGSLLSFGKKE